MRSDRTKALIRRIATDEKLDVKQVGDIVNSFFRFTSKTMADGDGENLKFSHIRLFKFGVFKVKEGRRKGIEKSRNEKSTGNKKWSTNNFSGSSNDQRVQEIVDKGQVSEKRQGA